jgi:N-acetylglucosaminyl-diphospho-decaprenol L-rhamnosyltransferase
MRRRGGELPASTDTPSAPRIRASAPPRPPNFILLLNPDTEVVDDALGQMVGFLRDHPRVGACGAHLRYGDGRFQHGAFRFPTLTQVALDLLPLASVPGVRRFLPRLLDSRWNGRYPQEQWMASAPFPVDFVLGAALMVRGEAIRQIGLLDEAYFMYCEEMDWCLRLQQAGWPVYALPTAHVIHYEGQSSKQVRWASFEQLWRSRFRFYSKHAAHYPPGHGIWFRLLVRLGLAIRSRQARRRFARGEITGTALAEELSAYTRILANGERAS